MVTSLPIKWVRARNLQKGDEINLQESGNDLVISSKESQKESITINDLENATEKDLRTLVSSIYRRGYDEVILETKSEFSFAEINRIVDTLTGYVITEQTPTKIIIKNTIKEDFEDLNSLMIKLFTTTHYFNEAVIKHVQSKNKDESEIDQLRMSIMRTRDYCQRMIRLTQHERNKSHEYDTIMFLLERIACDYHMIARFKDITDKGGIQRMKDFNEYLEGLSKVLQDEDKEKGLVLNQKIRQTLRKQYERKAALTLPIIENMFSLSILILGSLA